MTIRWVSILALPFCIIPLPLHAATTEAGNPMWPSGYVWECKPASKTVCGRENACRADRPEPEGFLLDYNHSQVTFGPDAVKIRRHYAQTVAGSPLQAEVKVELADNRVLWLTPVDASRVFSNIWTGALIEPKGGVVLSIISSILCSPAQ
ncbi:hypothetical protein ATN84_16015 [Paramesorhizobium deserti]|uniref:Uncharacterized protein n=1 Tax=Paramesorhizobium deserti TaxID=1494590 RepID=A0A135HT54_9HYPH|nr:hypothetical protein [Paramesorhizobium deserti]KXF76379.1 hypothetical protein ATN84_16015 [Paramesorhizobium deserti]